MKKILVIIAIAVWTLSSCTGNFSPKDKQIINSNPDSLLQVLTVDNDAENLVLRATSTDMSRHAIRSKDYTLLSQRMITTVQDTTVGGVGIAAPQVGINKRIVVVQRFDKPGEPFEAYPNIHIIEYSQQQRKGFEGCLSVPDRREEIVRSERVIISYSDPITTKDVRDTISGFTAVIFQHEVDHLEGIIYTDRLPGSETPADIPLTSNSF